MRSSVSAAGVLWIIQASSVLTYAQLDPNALRFEVATIRPNTSVGPPVTRVTPNYYSISGASLRILVQTAFDLPGYRVKGWPSWASERFDIAARTPEGRAFTRDEIMSMLQTLLADRFQLRFHYQPEEMDVLALIVDGGGPKMKEYREDDRGLDEFRGPDGEKEKGIHGHPARPTRFVGQGATIPKLAEMLTRIMGRTVLDRTALKGEYDFDFSWSAESTYELPAAGDPLSERASIFSSIRELGLKLEASKGPVQVYVIDSVQRPSEN